MLRLAKSEEDPLMKPNTYTRSWLLIVTTYALICSGCGKSSNATAPSGAKADLVISSGTLTATPSTVAPGETVTLSDWTVKNQGTAASGDFSNGFYLSSDATITTGDIYVDGNSNTSLAAGASFAWGAPTLTIPAGTAPGTYYLGILVDRSNT